MAAALAQVDAPPRQGAHGARARRREGEGREIWAQAETHGAPEAPSDQAPRRGRRDVALDWPQLQRERVDDFEVSAMNHQPHRMTIFASVLAIIVLGSDRAYAQNPIPYCMNFEMRQLPHLYDAPIYRAYMINHFPGHP